MNNKYRERVVRENPMKLKDEKLPVVDMPWSSWMTGRTWWSSDKRPTIIASGTCDTIPSSKGHSMTHKNPTVAMLPRSCEDKE